MAVPNAVRVKRLHAQCALLLLLLFLIIFNKRREECTRCSWKSKRISKGGGSVKGEDLKLLYYY